jgi:ABC-type transport system involved in multi-copper enzyme maturation permease subunit
MLGPHFYYDLIRLARKPRTVLLRCGYLLVLLAGLWLVQESGAGRSVAIRGHADERTINQLARLAIHFANLVLTFHYAMIFFLTPIYLAGALAEEKQNRTLELLFQTHLTDHEILLGKFGARLVHLLCLVLASLPILAILSLWGGISLERIAGHYMFSLFFLVGIGSISLWASLRGPSFLETMILAYGSSLALGGVFYWTLGWCFCLVGLFDHNPLYVMFLSLPWLVAASICFYFFALLELKELRHLKWVRREPPAPRRRTGPKRRRRPSPSRDIPDDHPLFWKEFEECKKTLPLPDFFLLVPVAYVVGQGIIFLIASPLVREALPIFVGFVVMGYLPLVAVLYLNQSFQATAAVARERERNTLEPLLLLPIPRHEILLVKWVVPWVRNRNLIFTILALPLLAMLFGMVSYSSALVLLLSPWPVLLFINGLGLLLSVVCRRVVTANLILISTLLGIFLVHLLCWRQFGLMLQGYFALLFGKDVVRGLDDDRWSWAVVLLALQQGLFLLSGLICLALAFWRFSRRTAEERTQVW